MLRYRHDYTIGTLDVLQACDACADMGMTYSVIVQLQCADCVVFPRYKHAKYRKTDRQTDRQTAVMQYVIKCVCVS